MAIVAERNIERCTFSIRPSLVPLARSSLAAQRSLVREPTKAARWSDNAFLPHSQPPSTKYLPAHTQVHGSRIYKLNHICTLIYQVLDKVQQKLHALLMTLLPTSKRSYSPPSQSFTEMSEVGLILKLCKNKCVVSINVIDRLLTYILITTMTR